MIRAISFGKSCLTMQKRFQSSSAIKELLVTPNRYNQKNSVSNLKPNLPKSGIFFHPTPSAPTPRQTPNAFLPPTDPRKDNELYTRTTANTIPLEYMPLLNDSSKTTKNYHLTKTDITEMQKLRNEGWTRKQLKEKFKCSNLFISLATDKNAKVAQREEERLEQVKSKWSEDTKIAKLNKEKKLKKWLRDQY
ncbi:hypothetical protein PACTADRAFT_50438 [Pachysolen tannophilus NRRL Y-2460]|uniref:Uncharacterized protein n=1 Tax=Pachysolen tannophilus NRRL Y-2460 TaxID=669874 RepID=A0A1E4TS45_PACTA|nr:hypothetical protein PACTADRAFT_50438 [Pachysolen tannophilus NRRL Y-2460]